MIRYKIYSEIFVDEWQLDKESRGNMQTVFGYLISTSFKPNNLYKFTFEYAFSQSMALFKQSYIWDL